MVVIETDAPRGTMTSGSGASRTVSRLGPFLHLSTPYPSLAILLAVHGAVEERGVRLKQSDPGFSGRVQSSPAVPLSQKQIAHAVAAGAAHAACDHPRVADFSPGGSQRRRSKQLTGGIRAHHHTPKPLGL
jgi:hypothetical protein